MAITSVPVGGRIDGPGNSIVVDDYGRIIVLNGGPGGTDQIYPRAAMSWPIPDRPLARRIMASPPTPTFTNAATISTPITVGPGFTSALYNGTAFRYMRAGGGVLTDTEPGRRTIDFNSVNYAGGGGTLANGFMVSFMHHGQYLEIKVGRHAQSFMLKVNDEYVSATPQASGGNDAADYYWYFDFGSNDLRRIDFLSTDWTGFRGVLIEQTGNVFPAAEPRGPRVMILGDSFAEGEANLRGIGGIFADAMGWDDVWTSAVGATGWANPATGGKVAIPARIATDVIPFAPDIIINLAGINDESYAVTRDALQTTIAGGLATIRAALPNCLLVNMGPCANGGPGYAPAAIYTKVLPALCEAFLAAGGYSIPLIELPLPDGFVQPTLTTLAAAAVDATTVRVSLNTNNAEMTLAPIDSEDRFYAKTNSASPSTWTQTLDGVLRVAIANGKALRVVGPSLWKGSGYVGATTGYGTNDIMTDTDGVHPTILGKRIIGETMAMLMIRQLRQLQRTEIGRGFVE